MAEYNIECLKCRSTDCRGCNTYTLSMMLHEGKFDCLMDDTHTINHYLDVVSAADVAPVVHGVWLKTEEPLGWHDVDCVECSACHESWVVDEDYGYDFLEFWHYCPNCGAKMTEE